jgi:hypothetical protein
MKTIARAVLTGATCLTIAASGLIGGGLAEASATPATAASPAPAMAGGPTPAPPMPATVGYDEVASDGGVFAFGGAHFYGSLGNVKLKKPVVGITATADSGGYYLVASDGGVFTFGDAQFYGSLGGKALTSPIVGMALYPGGGGYYLVAANGSVYTFGNAQFFGSAANFPLNATITGITPTPDGGGYFLIASDGSVYAFGDAFNSGSARCTPNCGPGVSAVGIVVNPDANGGYWTANNNGVVGFFPLSPADYSKDFYGPGTPIRGLVAPVVGISTTSMGNGYWLVAADGGIFSFGSAQFFGSIGGHRLNAPVVGMTPVS